MKKIFLILLCSHIGYGVIAQNVGIGTNIPNASAILELSAANQGLLVPRVSLTDINDVLTIPSAANSLLVYNRATAGIGILAVTPGFYYWDALITTWTRFSVAGNSQAGWLLGGNANSVNGNFIGTSNNQSLLFKINNTNAGYLGLTGNTYWGLNSGNINSNGYSNIAIGNGALLQTTSRSNLVAVGDSALLNNGIGALLPTDAINNTAIGSKALSLNNTGSYNTALGFNTLMLNTSGTYNTALGDEALRVNTTGVQNTASGRGAMFFNTTGSFNSAAGVASLGNNLSGNNNTAHGIFALFSNTTGYSNVAVGTNALRLNVNRSNLVAIGDSALFNNGTGASIAINATQNTATGSKALFSNTTGNANTALGFQSMNTNTTGTNNTALGSDADMATANLTNATAIGNVAVAGCSNCMVLGSVNGVNGATSSVNVGMGTTSPLMRLHVAKGDSAVALFENTQALNLNVSNALYFKTGSGGFPYTGAIKTTGESTTEARLGLFTYASTTPNQLLERLSITDIGNVGIGTISPLMKLHVAKNDSAVALLENTQSLSTNISNGLYFKTGSSIFSYTGAVKTIGEGTSAARLGLFTFSSFSPNGLLERLSISDVGYTGIGTTAPLMKLHVSKSDSAVAVFENTQFLNINVSTALYFKTGTGSLPYTGAVKTIGESTGAARIGFFTFASATPNALKERMSITDAGNVGIGAIIPQTDLHINPAGAGSILIGTNKFAGLHTTLEMGITAQSNGYTFIQATKASGSSYGVLAINENGGTVGIGTSQTDPLAKLTVGQNSGVGGAFSGIVATGNGNANNSAIKAIGTNNADALVIDGPIRSLAHNSRVIYRMSTQTISAGADGYLDDTYTPGVTGSPDGHVVILINNPLCNGDPTAVILYSWVGYYEKNKNFQSFLYYDPATQRWNIKYYYDTYLGSSINHFPELNIMIVKQ